MSSNGRLPVLCTLCGRQPVGAVEVSLHGELTCAHHGVSGRCVLCGRAGDADPAPGWRPILGSRLRCPTCAAGAVETQADARRYLPSVRREMTSIGIRLDTPVRVEVVDGREFHPAAVAGEGILLGVTEQRRTPGQRWVEVARIQIIRGLTPTHFGRTVAHELGHAWLAQRGVTAAAPMVEEGVCELFAHAWLKRQGSALAAAMRAHLRDNPDPVYGGGFRAVHGSVVRHGIDAVLHDVARTGRIP
ncbi:MAG TPA: protein DA1 [Pseudonocardiaceae bacterium]|jgi:hypothetical protein|nr:protein DA1 [Pseudonocardiaceae bacterium]